MTKWTKEYDNDTGPCDDYFEEWWNVTDGNHIYRCKNSDDADFLIAALAQQEQEPVAWYIREKDVATTDGEWAEKNLDMCEPIYTTPPQRKPLTDEQREEIAKGWRGRNWTVGDIIDATEAAHNIKENT